MLKKTTAKRYAVYICAIVSLFASTAAFSGTENTGTSAIPGDDHGKHRGHLKGSLFTNPSNRHDLHKKHRHHEKRKHERHEKRHHEGHGKKKHHGRH
jgi:hypothetical protein